MLETILTRIILRYANKYICDTFHTDTFSLWGGDLVVQNFELRAAELTRVLGDAGSSLQLVRGFVRELRVHVPWNAIRSQSLRVEVDAVEVVLGLRRNMPARDPDAFPVPMSCPPTPDGRRHVNLPVTSQASQTPQEGLDEAGETWLQPLLRTIFGNLVVAANNLVAKISRNGATGCLTLGTLESKPHSARWEPGFMAIAVPQPTLYRAVSIRDVSVTLDHTAQHSSDRRWGQVRRAFGRHTKARQHLALPLLHRLSVEIFAEWPWLPWPALVHPAPTSRVDVHLSPIRVRMSDGQARLLAQLLRPEDVLLRAEHSVSSGGGGVDPEGDSNSDRYSMRSHSGQIVCTSEPSTAVPTTDGGTAQAPSPEVPPLRPLRASSKSPLSRQTSGDRSSELRGLSGFGAERTIITPLSETALEDVAPPDVPPPATTGGLRGLLVDVLFGADEEDEEEAAEEELRPDLARGASALSRETRRAWCVALCTPLVAVTLELQHDDPEATVASLSGSGSRGLGAAFGLPAPAGGPVITSREASWVGTLSFISLGAFVLVPARGEALPTEGTLELHHVSLQVPDVDGIATKSALSWGSPLACSPLEADDPFPLPPNSRSRAEAWAGVGRKLLGSGIDVLHASHCVLSGGGAAAATPVPCEREEAAAGAAVVSQAAVRVGLLLVAPPPAGAAPEEQALVVAAGSTLLHLSVQLSEARLCVDPAWCAGLKSLVQPLAALSGGGSGGAGAGQDHRARLVTGGGLPGADLQAWAEEEEEEEEVPETVLQVVVASAGVHAQLGPFVLELGLLRMDWRNCPHVIDEVQLAASLRETTVFISSAFTHMQKRRLSPERLHEGQDDGTDEGSLAVLRLSAMSLHHRRAAANLAPQEEIARLLTLRDFALAAVTPKAGARLSVTHLEVTLAECSGVVSLPPLRSAHRAIQTLLGARGREEGGAGGGGGEIGSHAAEQHEDARALSAELQNLHVVLRSARRDDEEGLVEDDHLSGAHRSPMRGDADSIGSSTSETETDEAPPERMMSHASQRHSDPLCVRQLLLYLRTLRASYLDGVGGSSAIFAPYQLHHHGTPLLDELAGAMEQASQRSLLNSEAVAALVCQLCPVAPPRGHRIIPPHFEVWLPLPADCAESASETLQRGRPQCCTAWLGSMHVALDSCWLTLAMDLAAGASGGGAKAAPRQESFVEPPRADGAERLAAAVLCSLSGAALPSFVWLASTLGPHACLTLPLVLASDPQLQAHGLSFTCFNDDGAKERAAELVHLPTAAAALPAGPHQPLSLHASSELQRCLALARGARADASAPSHCLSIAQLAGSVWRREVHEAMGASVCVSVQVHLSPLRWCIRPPHIHTLAAWALSLQSPTKTKKQPGGSLGAAPAAAAAAEEAGAPAVRGLAEVPSHRLPLISPRRTSRSPGRLRVVFSLRVRASMDGTVEADAGRLDLRIPCIAGSCHQVEDAAQGRSRATLRISRPHVVLRVAPTPSLDLVEWCEEKVYGDDDVGQGAPMPTGRGHTRQSRAACWLSLSVHGRKGQPLELAASSLPLGLCVAVAPLLRFFTSFAAAGAAPSRPPGDPTAESDGDRPSSPAPAVVSRQPCEGRLRAQASVGAVSIRLFPESPFTVGTPHVAICVAEASAQSVPDEPPSLRAVVSVSLFEQAEAAEAPVDEVLSGGDATPTGVPVPVCILDDLLRPCTICISETGSTLSVELDAVHVEILHRAHFCTLLAVAGALAESVGSGSGPGTDAPGGQEEEGEGEGRACSSPARRRGPGAGPRREAQRAPPSEGGQAKKREKDKAQGGQDVELRVQALSLQLPGRGEAGRARLEVEGLRLATTSGAAAAAPGAATAAQRVAVSCESLRAALAAGGRQSVEVSQLGVSLLSSSDASGGGSMEATVSVDGLLRVHLCTGCIFRDVSELWPSSVELAQAAGTPAGREQGAVASLEGVPHSEGTPQREEGLGGEAAAAVGVAEEALAEVPPPAAAAHAAPVQREVKWRLLLSTVEGHLTPAAADSRRVALSLLGFSVFSWPASHVAVLGPGQMSKKRIDISVESASATASAGLEQLVDSPLVSPFSVQGSVVTYSPEAMLGRSCSRRTRTEVDFRFSPVLISAGAWQMRLITDVFSFSDPDAREEIADAGPIEEPPNEEPSPVAASVGSQLKEEPEILFVELSVQLDGEPSPLAQGPGTGYGIPLALLCGVPLEELNPGQAVRLEEEPCPRYALRLDRPGRVTSVAVHDPAQLVELAPDGPLSSAAAADVLPLELGVDCHLEAWSDSLRSFVDVTDAEPGDAVCSHLLALRLPVLGRLPVLLRRRHQARLLVEILLPSGGIAGRASPPSELVLSLSAPRVTWSVLHTAACCNSTTLEPVGQPVPALEEPFGDVSFHSIQFSMWQAACEGMALTVAAEKFGVELYEMATLSLAQVVLPDENSIMVAVQQSRAAAEHPPVSVPLRSPAHLSAKKRRMISDSTIRTISSDGATPRAMHSPSGSQSNALDVDDLAGKPAISIGLGSWRIMLPPWGLARLVHLGQSLAGAWSSGAGRPSGKAPAARAPRRLPVVVENALPIQLVFGQVGSEESLLLQPGCQRAYIWRFAAPERRQVTLGLPGNAPRSSPLLLGSPPSKDSDVAKWAIVELYGDQGKGGERAPAHVVHVCVRQVSRVQRVVTVLPPVLLFSHLTSPLEFAVAQGDGVGAGVPAQSRNSILDARRFLVGLPTRPQFERPAPPAALAAAVAPTDEAVSHGGDDPRQGSPGTSAAATGSPATSAAAPGSPAISPAATGGRESLLPPGQLLGILPRAGSLSTVRLRMPGQQVWGPQLPLLVGVEEPYATLIPFGVEAQTVLGCCKDLWAVQRRPPSASCSAEALQFRAAAEAPLPQVFHVWPLLLFRNFCPFHTAVTAQPLGTVSAAPGQEQVLVSCADPRQLQVVELHASCGSTGALPIAGLTQFPHDEGDEAVSWRNSVRVQGCMEGAMHSEVLLLLELRRCKLSGLLRSIACEPMWSIDNEAGSSILFRAPGASAPLHEASVGRTVSALLGPLQHDPSFPLVACVGVRLPESGGEEVVWSEAPQRIAMGQSTRVEVAHGRRCFVLLVSINHRHRVPGVDAGGKAVATSGGVHIRLYAGAYVRCDVEPGLQVTLGGGGDSDEHTVVYAARGAGGLAPPVPWPWWPLEQAALVGALGRPGASKAAAAAAPESGGAASQALVAGAEPLPLRLWLSMEGSYATEALLNVAREGGARGNEPFSTKEVLSVADLLAPPSGANICSGYLRDVCLDMTCGARASLLLNVSFHLEPHGCFMLGLLRSKQPPIMCVNHSMHTFWLGDPHLEKNELLTNEWRRIPPGVVLELPCPELRTLEVFPPGVGPSDLPMEVDKELEEESPSTAAKAPGAVHVRLSMDPAGSMGEHLDLKLDWDADVRWALPLDVPIMVAVRRLSGVCRLEILETTPNLVGALDAGAWGLPAPTPRRCVQLPLQLDLTTTVAGLVVHFLDEKASLQCRSLAVHLQRISAHVYTEAEATTVAMGRDGVKRTSVTVDIHSLSVADVCRTHTPASLKQIVAAPPFGLQLRLCQPPLGLPTAYELLRISLPEAEEPERGAVTVSVDDSFMEFVQALASDIAAEFKVESTDTEAEPQGDDATRVRAGVGAPAPEQAALPPLLGEEFHYVSLSEFSVPPLPICVDLRLSSPVFVSFTGLALVYPAVRLTDVITTRYMLGQELLAHCIAFFLLNSPVLLASCDLLGNPVQMYRHLRSGLRDLFHRPVREGLRSLAWHMTEASLASISGVSDSLRRNLVKEPGAQASPGGLAGAAAPAAAAAAQSENGLAAGARALLDGVGRGLVGVVRWEQHTPDREGALGHLRGARNAVAGAVAHPVGGLLDFVTVTARSLVGHGSSATVEPPGSHSAARRACLARWALHSTPDTSPWKFHLQACQGLPRAASIPSVLFWSPRCELVRVDADGGADGLREPNLRLIPAGLLLTTAQLCVLVDAGTAHVLDISEVQAAEEARGRPSTLVTIASTAGRIWQLHVRCEQPGELTAHLRRAQRLLGLPPARAV